MRNINILLFDDAPHGAGLPSCSVVKNKSGCGCSSSMRNINILLLDDAPNGAGLPLCSIVKKQIWICSPLVRNIIICLYAQKQFWMWLPISNAKYNNFVFWMPQLVQARRRARLHQAAMGILCVSKKQKNYFSV